MTKAKGSAIAEIAADLGSSVPLTGSAPENPGAGDLFRSLDDEVDQFGQTAIRPPVKRGAGRPAGSPNRTTLQLQRYLQARGYRDPAEFLAAIVSTDPRRLAVQLLGHDADSPAARAVSLKLEDVLEVVKLQKGAAAELMPYFHSRMPLAVHHTGDAPRPLVIINEGGPMRDRKPGDGAMSVFDLLLDQGVSIDPASPSDAPSDETASDESE